MGRSANDFPVGALTGQEWIDDYKPCRFEAVTAEPRSGDANGGVIMRGNVGSAPASTDMPLPDAQVVSWEGDDANRGLRQQLRGHLAGHSDPVERPDAPSAEPGESASPAEVPTDVVWMIDATLQNAVELGRHLDELAQCCRRLAENPARLWVVVDFGDLGRDDNPIHQPIWCARTAAVRVAQNEYAGLQIRCLGLAGPEGSAASARAAEDMVVPDDEREIFHAGDRRLVFRIYRGAGSPAAPRRPSDDTAIALTGRHETGRSGITWTSARREELEPGHVEIEVAATGLNFRDVMWNLRLLPEEALEDGYAGPGLGMECAGRIARIGPGVAEFKPGDPVVAFAPRAFASHVVAPVFAVLPLPAKLPFEAASTIPVAFLTAYYSLVHLGQLNRGETLLVHGGAGAVGLAAMQIARHRGATIIATAGSEEKRAFLRSCGADLVCNSRTVSFAAEVSAFTGGRGVDIVLNSLAGEAMIRSMDCLRPFGRFIELGKRDFYANTHLGLRPLRRNLSYFGVDVDQLIGEHKELTRRLFGEVVQLFADGVLSPLPHRIFSGDHVTDAFRLMQRSGHIGKIVVRPAEQTNEAAGTAASFRVDREGAHIVIGGTSGFGLATAEWLVARGATRVTLASRSAARPIPTSPRSMPCAALASR